MEHKSINTCTKIQLKIIGVIKNLVAYRKIRCSQMSVVRYWFFLACDEELCRPQADTSSAFGRRHERRRLDRPEPETALEKPLAPRVVVR